MQGGDPIRSGKCGNLIATIAFVSIIIKGYSSSEATFCTLITNYTIIFFRNNNSFIEYWNCAMFPPVSPKLRSNHKETGCLSLDRHHKPSHLLAVPKKTGLSIGKAEMGCKRIYLHHSDQNSVIERLSHFKELTNEQSTVLKKKRRSSLKFLNLLGKMADCS